MPDQIVKGEEALKRMAARALSQPLSLQKGDDEGKDPLEEATKFKKQMAASAIIESEVAKSKAEAEEAEAKAAKARAEVKKAEGGGDESVKPGFKLSGGVDLGHIDLQKEREEAQNELRRLKKEADDSAKALGQENQQLREQIHQQEMKVLEITLKTQIEQLGELIKANATRGTFMDQYNTAIEMAKTLGFSQPIAGGNLGTQIELKKLEFENTRELRRLAKEDKAEERRWQLELRRLEDDRAAKKEEREQQVKRDEMFASFPQRLGGAIAQGYLAKKGEETTISETPRGKRGKDVEAGVGEAGEITCITPRCGQPVAIGPTARVAVCANCGTRYPIRRIEQTSSESETEEE